MKERIINISLILVGIAMLVLIYFNLPAKLYTFNTIPDCNLYTVVYLENFALYFTISLMLLIIFKKEYLNFKGFKEYIVVLSIILFVTLLIYFIQDFNYLGQELRYLGILFDGVIIPIINTFIKGFILFGLIIIPLFSMIKIEKNKYLIIAVTSFILLSIINILPHIKDYKDYVYYIGEALCFSTLSVYIIYNENSLLTPVLYYAICRICVLPNCFSSIFVDTILPVARIGCGVFYICVGALVFTLGIRKEITS